MEALLGIALSHLQQNLQQERENPSLGDFASLRDAVPDQYWNDSAGSDAAYDILDPLAGLLRVIETCPPDEPRNWLAALDLWLAQDSVKTHVGADYWPKCGIEMLRGALGGTPRSPGVYSGPRFVLERASPAPARVASSSRAHVFGSSELFTPQAATSEEHPAESAAAPSPAERFTWSASMATGASAQ